MSEADLIHETHVALVIVLIMSLPPLIAAAIVGLMIGLLQAVTQIQDQTLSLVFKLLAVMLTLMVVGPLLLGPLLDQTEHLLAEFPAMTR